MPTNEKIILLCYKYLLISNSNLLAAGQYEQVSLAIVSDTKRWKNNYLALPRVTLH